MEAIDGANNIQIEFFKENFKELSIVEDSESITAIRYSYIVCDNGKGTDEVKAIFNFGKSESKL